MTTRRVMAGVVICLLALLLAGCTTSFEEWSGEMPNETGTHVKPYDVDQGQNTNESIKPAGLMLTMRLVESALQPEIRFAERMNPWAAAKPSHLSATPAARAHNREGSLRRMSGAFH